MKLWKTVLVFGLSVSFWLTSCGVPPPSALTPTTTSTELPPPEANIILEPDISDLPTGQTIRLAVDTSAPRIAAYIESHQELQFQELQFKWSVKRGTLSALDGPSVIYTAPDTPGLDTITLEVISALGTTTKSVIFNIIVPPTDTLTPSSTPLPPPLMEIFPQAANGQEFVFINGGGLLTPQFVIDENCMLFGIYGLRITYDMQGESNGGWGVRWASSPAGHFDASSFDVLTFWVRGMFGGETFQVSLMDTNGRGFWIDSRELLVVSSDWREVIVPFSKFQGVDMSSLENVNISFDSSNGSGSICIDDFAFASFIPTNTFTPEVTDVATATTGTATSTPTITSTPTFHAPTPNGSQILQAAFDEVDRQLQDIKSNIAYNAPETMKLDDTVTIELLLNPSLSEMQLATQAIERGEQRGEYVTSTAEPGKFITEQGEEPIIVTSEIQITDQMKAVLTSKDPNAFVIQASHDNAEQPISKINTTTWRWNVTAKKRGIQTLELVIHRLIKIEGTDYWREVESFREDIIVEVTLPQWIKETLGLDWRWLLTTLLIPLFLWWLNNRRKRSDEQKVSSQQRKRYKS